MLRRFLIVWTVLVWAGVLYGQEISLDGVWDVGREVTAGQRPAVWERSTVPEARGLGESVVWYRRDFEVPAGERSRRVVLHFKSVLFVGEFFVNGQAAGKKISGFTPFDVDVTDRVQVGTNRVEVRVSNYQAIQGNYPVGAGLVPVTTGDLAFTAPSGTQGGKYWGLVGGVRLRIFPATHIDDVYVKPSVRQKNVGVEVTVKNSSAGAFRGKLAIDVVDGSATVVQVPVREIQVAPKTESVVECATVPADRLALWWPVTFRPESVGDTKPKLYVLVVRLVDENGRVVHESRTRFGYREFRVDGMRFCLNGVPLYLFGTGAHWGEGSRDPAEFYRLVLHTGARIVRLHGMLRDESWYDAADEMGILVKSESAMFGSHQHFAVTAPEFWANCREHLRDWIRSLRNHPSVAMWSLSNEMGLDGLGKITDPHMAELYRRMRRVDDTRPYEAEADGDVGGALPVINIHCWWDYQKPMFLEDNYWPEWTPVRKGYRSVADQALTGKPLYIGEFSPDYTDNRDQAVIVEGDRAYEPGHDKRYEGYGRITRGRIEGYRWTGVAGIGPWTVFETGGIPSLYSEQHRRAYRPMALLMRDAAEHFFGGREYSLRLMALNDSADRRDLTVAWKLDGGSRSGTEIFSLVPAEHRKFQIKLVMPSVKSRTGFKFTVRLIEGSREWDRIEKTYWVFPAGLPAKWQGANSVIVCEGPKVKIAGVLQRMGLLVRVVESNALSGLTAPGVLVLGPGGADHLPGKVLAVVHQFVRAGGVVVDLGSERMELVPDLRPLGRGPHAIQFVRSGDHPVWQSPWPITDVDLRWWQGGPAVCGEMVLKPQQGAFRILADGGYGNQGASLVEFISGHGRFLLCRMHLAERVDVEPMAGEILRRLVRYAQDRTAATGGDTKAVGVCADGRLTLFLDERETPYQTLSDLSENELKKFSTIIFQGSVLEPRVVKSPVGCRNLRRFVEAGGTAVLKDLSVGSEFLLGSFLPGLAWRPGWGSQAVPISDSPLLSGLSGSDFRWCEDGPDNAIYNRHDLGYDEVTLPGAKGLIEPGFIREVRIGKGRVVIDQIDWLGVRNAKGLRIGSTLLTNLGLGGTLADPGSIDPEAFFAVDLDKVANRRLRDQTANDGQGGWTDQGENDLRNLPVGDRMFRGLPFRVSARDGGRGIVLAGAHLQKGLPRVVKGIAVGRKAAGLVFLHGCAWDANGVAWRYIVHYADGTKREVPVRYGRHVLNWWTTEPGDLPEARLAWPGSNPQHSVLLYAQEWVNPEPEKVIDRLDIVSEMQAVPFVLAITGRAKPGKVAAKVPEATLEPVRLPLAMTAVERPMALTAGPVSVVIDRDGNFSDWKVDGKTMLAGVGFGPRTSTWALAAAPNLASRWTKTANGSTVVVTEGSIGYLDVQKITILRPQGTMQMSLRAQVRRTVTPAEFHVLRMDFQVAAANMIGGTFNVIPLTKEYRGQVISCGGQASQFRFLRPDGVGLEIRIPPSEYYLFDYRGKPDDSPAAWTMPVELPVRREAGSVIEFRMEVRAVGGAS